MRIAAAAAAVLALTAADPSAPIVYTFDQVKSKVVLEHAGDSGRVHEGDTGVAGDLVRTGWFGRAVLSVPARASRFELYASTRARLAGTEPGVLIELERGRLKGIFDALVGAPERAVATPGAILAVRGTRYGVEVGRDGDAVLTVFEGVVELRPRAPGSSPVLVRGGQMARYGHTGPPRVGPMPSGLGERDWDRGRGPEPGTANAPTSGAPGAGPGAGAAPGSGQRPPGAGSGRGGGSS